jgi:opine dehydrogenase
MKIGIIGAGNTGVACAAHLVSAGHEPIVFTRSSEKAAALRAGVAVSGAVSGEFSFDATTDLAQMLRQVSIVVVCTWANAHGQVVAAIDEALQKLPAAPRDPLDIVVFNGNWGAYEAYAQLGGNPAVGCIAETSGMPYVASLEMVRAGASDGGATASGVGGAATQSAASPVARLDFPAIKTTITAAFTEKNSEAQRFLEGLYADVEIADSLFETSLMAPNPIIHAPLCLLNMTKIEAGERFSMLTDGFSERAENLVAHIDEERAALASALGCGYEPILAQLNGQWGSGYPTLTELFHSNPVYSSLQGPSDTGHRFIQEDIPYGIAPLVSLGAVLNVATPACSALLSVYSMYFGHTFAGPEFEPSVIAQLRRKIES